MYVRPSHSFPYMVEGVNGGEEVRVFLVGTLIHLVPDDGATVMQTGTTLANAVANAGVYIAVTSGLSTQRVFTHATPSTKIQSPHEIRLELPHSFYKQTLHEGVVNVHINDSARINVAADVYAVSSSGTLCLHMAGSGNDNLATALEHEFADVMLRYSTVNEVHSTVSLHKLHLEIGEAPGGGRLETALPRSVTFTKVDSGLDYDTMQLALLSMVQSSSEMRSKTPYFPDAPSFGHKAIPLGLSKTWSVDGKEGDVNYSTISGLLDRDLNMSADTLESLLSASLRMETSESGLVKFMQRNGSTSKLHFIGAEGHTKDVVTAARTIRTFNRFVYRYKADVWISRDANSISSKSVEHWGNYPALEPFITDGDCDDSSSDLQRTCRAIGISPFGDDLYKDGVFHSIDPEFDESKHPITAAIRRALSSHTMLLAIVSASSGQGTDASEKQQRNHSDVVHAESSHLAGHGIGVFLPTPRMLNAMDLGSSFGNNCTDESCRAIRDKRFLTFYPPGKVAAFDAHDHSHLESHDAMISTFDARNADGICAKTYTVDGTVTCDVYPTRDNITTEEMKARRIRSQWATAIGPVIADRVVDLTTPDGENLFLRAWVEATVGAHDEKDATQFAVVPGDARHMIDIAPAGADVHSIAGGALSFVALTEDNQTLRDGLSTVAHQAKINAFPARREPRVAEEWVVTNVQTSIAMLKKFEEMITARTDANLARDAKEDHDFVTLEYRLVPAAIIGNPSAIQATINSWSEHAIGGEVRIYNIDGALVDTKGETMIHAVTVDIFVPARERLSSIGK